MFLSVKIYTPLIYRKLITPRVLETPLSYSTSIYRKVGTIIKGSPQVIYIIITLEEGKKSRKKKDDNYQGADFKSNKTTKQEC